MSDKVTPMQITNPHLLPHVPAASEHYVVERYLLGAKHRIETIVFGNGQAMQTLGSGEPDVGRWDAEKMTIEMDHATLDLAGRIALSRDDA